MGLLRAPLICNLSRGLRRKTSVRKCAIPLALMTLESFDVRMCNVIEKDKSVSGILKFSLCIMNMEHGYGNGDIYLDKAMHGGEGHQSISSIKAYD